MLEPKSLGEAVSEGRDRRSGENSQRWTEVTSICFSFSWYECPTETRPVLELNNTPSQEVREVEGGSRGPSVIAGLVAASCQVGEQINEDMYELPSDGRRASLPPEFPLGPLQPETYRKGNSVLQSCHRNYSNNSNQ